MSMPLPLAAPNDSNLLPCFKKNVYIRNHQERIGGLSISTTAREEPWIGGGVASTASLPALPPVEPFHG